MDDFDWDQFFAEIDHSDPYFDSNQYYESAYYGAYVQQMWNDPENHINYDDDDDDYDEEQTGGGHQYGLEEEEESTDSTNGESISETPGPESNLNRHFDVSEQFEQHIKQLNTSGKALVYTFKNMDSVNDVYALIADVIDHAIDTGFKIGGPTSLVALQITHPGQSVEKGPIFIWFTNREKLTTSKVVNKIQSVQQSNESFLLDNRLEIQITSITPPPHPQPGGNRADKTAKGAFEQYRNNKKATVDH